MAKPSLPVLEACPPIRADAGLIREGWTRRYLAESERAREAAALYEGLGHEVLLRAPEPSQLRPECGACGAVACRDYLLIYTRRREP